jgi:hypothetical protein
VENGRMILNEEDKKWIQTLNAELRSALEESIVNMETKLPTEFHRWASPV